MGKLLTLSCPTCNAINNTPLRVGGEYSWAKVAAYRDCLSFCDIVSAPEEGDIVTAQVIYPVCCHESGTFSVTDGYSGRVFTLRLLKILKSQKHEAKVRVEILSVNQRQFFAMPIAEEMKEKLIKEKTYDYKTPPGDHLCSYEMLDNRTAIFRNGYGGGDVGYADFIFTDAEGFDHLLQSCYYDFDRNEAYFGDKVIGHHQFSPFFPPPRRLADGSKAPNVPYRYKECLARLMKAKGYVSFLKEALGKEQEKILRFSSENGKYTSVHIDWLGGIRVDGFLYVVRNILEESEEALSHQETVNLYNELVRDFAAKSHSCVGPLEKFLL